MSLFNNFGIVMPSDIVRHPDGSPMQYVSDENREMFLAYCKENKIDIESMSHQERDKIFVKWKQQK